MLDISPATSFPLILLPAAFAIAFGWLAANNYMKKPTRWVATLTWAGGAVYSGLFCFELFHSIWMLGPGLIGLALGLAARSIAPGVNAVQEQPQRRRLSRVLAAASLIAVLLALVGLNAIDFSNAATEEQAADEDIQPTGDDEPDNEFGEVCPDGTPRSPDEIVDYTVGLNLDDPAGLAITPFVENSVTALVDDWLGEDGYACEGPNVMAVGSRVMESTLFTNPDDPAQLNEQAAFLVEQTPSDPPSVWDRLAEDLFDRFTATDVNGEPLLECVPNWVPPDTADVEGPWFIVAAKGLTNELVEGVELTELVQVQSAVPRSGLPACIFPEIYNDQRYLSGVALITSTGWLVNPNGPFPNVDRVNLTDLGVESLFREGEDDEQFAGMFEDLLDELAAGADEELEEEEPPEETADEQAQGQQDQQEQAPQVEPDEGETVQPRDEGPPATQQPQDTGDQGGQGTTGDQQGTQPGDQGGQGGQNQTGGGPGGCDQGGPGCPGTDRDGPGGDGGDKDQCPGCPGKDGGDKPPPGGGGDKPKPPPPEKDVTVCRPGVGVITIPESQVRPTDLPANAPECKPPPPEKKVTVCRRSTGQVITIPESEVNTGDPTYDIFQWDIDTTGLCKERRSGGGPP